MITDRLRREEQDSSAAYCDSLLNTCEFVIRHLTSVLCAALPQTEEANETRYRAEYTLLRSSGIGDWARTCRDLLSGPNFQDISSQLAGVGIDLALFTRPARKDDENWIKESILALRRSLEVIGEMPNDSSSFKLIEFLNEFPRLRNKMDAHGAPTSFVKSQIATELEILVKNLLSRIPLLATEIVQARFQNARNSNDTKVVDVVGNAGASVRVQFEEGFLPYEQQDGLFAVIGDRVQRLNLIDSDEELLDFYYANGNLKEKDQSAEFLSYITSRRKRVDCKRWSAAPVMLSESSTAGSRTLRYYGNTLTNHPPEQLKSYISRPVLEKKVSRELVAPYRRFVTLRGLGGIGKTTLALAVVEQACVRGEFDVVIWVSARDLDLADTSSRAVRPSVQTTHEVATLCNELFAQVGEGADGDHLEHLSKLLESNEFGRVLWVLDNFETIQDPGEFYSIFDRSLGPSNRVLITTRHRDFQGDFSVEVQGLERDEFAQLVGQHAERIGLSTLPREKIDQLFSDTDGHPYIAKMMVSEMKSSPLTGAKNVLQKATLQDDLLERTYSRLSDGAVVLLLLLSTFSSAVPLTAIRVAVNSDTLIADDLDQLLDELASNSILDITFIEQDSLVQMPSVAIQYGKRKLKTHEHRTSIESMSRVLQMFGPISRDEFRRYRGTGDHTDLAKRFWQSMRRTLGGNESNRDLYLAQAREVARTYPEVWRMLGEFLEETEEYEESLAMWKSFIESGSNYEIAWKHVATLAERLDRLEEALQAWVSRAQCSDASIADLDFAAGKVNGWLSNTEGHNRVTLSRANKQALIEPLCREFEQKLEYCNATNLSKYAHLLRRIQSHQRADEMARLGLEREPDNQYCLRFLNLN